MIFYPEDFGAVNDGKVNNSKPIQEAIDQASSEQGTVVLRSGVYLSGAIFLKDHVTLLIEQGAELRGIMDESAYPLVPSRVAGVEMIWPAGLINIMDCQNVSLIGKGLINGQGHYWWDKYWTMRKEYEKKNLRWAVDYDCFRPRNVIVHNSQDIELKDFTCIQSPFWNVHICYSSQITIENLIIKDNQGPSTDGIDIDSSHNVIVRGCSIDCNDDNICIKSGRDWDGLRVDIPCHHVLVEDCDIGLGEGITLGSETSGGMYDIKIINNRFKGTKQGLRIKSAENRGGYVEKIEVSDLLMNDVGTAFSFVMNWNPAYSYCEIPKEYENKYPEYWDILSHPVAREKGIPLVGNIDINRVKVSTFNEKTKGFLIEGLDSSFINNVNFTDLDLQVNDFGNIQNAARIQFNNCKVSLCMG